MGLKTYVLPNGLRLHCYPMPEKKVVCFGAVIYGGSIADPEGKEGLQHACEHMVFRGTEKHADMIRLLEPIERYNGQARAFTSSTMTKYSVTLPVEQTELAVDYLKQLLFHPLFKRSDWEIEREVIREEIRESDGKVVLAFGKAIAQKVLPPASPLGKRYTVGSEESIAEISCADFEELVVRMYVPSNMDLVLTGNFPEDSVNLIKRHFGNLSLPQHKIPRYFHPAPRNRPIRFTMADRRVTLPQIVIGGILPEFSGEEHDKLSLFAVMLGRPGQKTSPIFQELRHAKGLFYSGGVQVSVPIKGISIFEFHCSAKKDKFAAIEDEFAGVWDRTLRSEDRFLFSKDQVIAEMKTMEYGAYAQFNRIVSVLDHQDLWIEDEERIVRANAISFEGLRTFVENNLNIKEVFVARLVDTEE